MGLLCPVHSLVLPLSLDLQQDPEAETLVPHLSLCHSGYPPTYSPPVCFLAYFSGLTSGVWAWCEEPAAKGLCFSKQGSVPSFNNPTTSRVLSSLQAAFLKYGPR